MKNLLLLLILILLLCTKLTSQNYYCNCDINDSYPIDIEDKLFGRIFINRFINYDSQFFYRWAKGDVTLYDSTVLKNKYIRYNHYLDELIWTRKLDYKSAIIDKQSVRAFSIYDDNNAPVAHFIKTRLKNWYENDSIDIFLQVLVEGNISLYAVRKIELIENVIYNKDRYYVLLEGNYNNFKPSRVNLLRLFPGKRAEFRSILRKNKLQVRHEDQLIKAIELYNTF